MHRRPPALSHGTKWKEWLFRTGTDPTVDSLAVPSNVLEEFMDVGANEESAYYDDWVVDRERVVSVLEEYGFRYYRGGRVLPSGQAPDEVYPPVAPAGRIDAGGFVATHIGSFARLARVAI